MRWSGRRVWGGGLLVEADGGLAVDSSAAEALDRAAAWVGEISPETVTVFQEEDARWMFQNGNAAFMRNWPYAYGLGQAEDSPIRDRFGVTRLPKGEGPEGATCERRWRVSRLE